MWQPISSTRSRAKQREQALRAVGTALDDVSLSRLLLGAYSSSIVHDVNAVHGLLDHWRRRGRSGRRQPLCRWHGRTGHRQPARRPGAVDHVASQPSGSCRITASASHFYFDDFALELEFPSPYLNHQPTRLTVRTGNGEKLSAETIACRLQGSLRRGDERLSWSAIVEGTPVRNTAEHAARDMELLCRAGALAARTIKQKELRS